MNNADEKQPQHHRDQGDAGQGNVGQPQQFERQADASAFVSVPYAHVIEPSSSENRSFRLAYILLGLVLLGILLGIGWSWWEQRGLPIAIEFSNPTPELAPGTSVTLNGVRVGEVTDVSLKQNQMVEVAVRLIADDEINRMIAREGSVFWIPEFTADLVKGFRNVGAVFATEIAVRPGTGDPKYRFSGTEGNPPNVWVNAGELPVVLRAERNRGVVDGSPVLYRGLTIGEVVHTQLSRDSSQFEAWLRISADYRDLVRTNSHFVDSSGVNLDVGIVGFTLDMENLQSAVTGSIQLFTPTDYGEAAQAGREFQLEAEAQDDYFTWKPYIEFEAYRTMYNEAALERSPNLEKATLTWNYARGWGWMADGEGSNQGLALITEQGILAPRNLMIPADTSAKNITLRVGSREIALTPDEITWHNSGLAFYEDTTATTGWPTSGLRVPTEPESATVYGPGGLRKLLDQEYFTATDGKWRVGGPSAFHSGWNGAAVVSTRDANVIGLLIVEDHERAVCQPLPEEAPFFEQPAAEQADAPGQ